MELSVRRRTKMQRIRILYSKKEPIQFTGALDMQKIWERAFRRCQGAFGL